MLLLWHDLPYALTHPAALEILWSIFQYHAVMPQYANAVAYIVFSADEEPAYRKHKGALEETVKSMLSLNVDYPGKPKKVE